jgi:ketosteroid isomerase-like protein
VEQSSVYVPESARVELYKSFGRIITANFNHKECWKMKSLIALGLLVAMVVPVFGVARADAPSVEQTLMQMERDWTQAGLKKDAAAMDKIVADDWVAFSFDGKMETKAEAMADLKSGASTTQSVELGAMKVRVFGDTAVVTGSDTEKSTFKGKDSSGKYVWTDVFVKRQGHWQAAASQSTKVEK